MGLVYCVPHAHAWAPGTKASVGRLGPVNACVALQSQGHRLHADTGWNMSAPLQSPADKAALCVCHLIWRGDERRNEARHLCLTRCLELLGVLQLLLNLLCEQLSVVLWTHTHTHTHTTSVRLLV